MPPHVPPPDPGPLEPFGFKFPSLPIVTPDPLPRSPSQKYGSFLYLGVLGLVVVVSLVGWFALNVWSLRGVWTNIYVLHDGHRAEADRIRAAYALSRDPRTGQRSFWEMSLRKPLPGLARYLLAEALTARIVADDPRAYGAAVAKSAGWPDWLRLLLTRPLAYAAARGDDVPHEALGELSRNSDPAVALWADYALAASRQGDPEAAGAAQRSSAGAARGRTASWAASCSKPSRPAPTPDSLSSIRPRSGSARTTPRPPASGKAGEVQNGKIFTTEITENTETK